MSSQLKIRNLNEKKADASPIPHDFMPQPPFRMVVCWAAACSGCWLLGMNGMYNTDRRFKF